ncbi:MAG: polyprenyl synthetase family protein [Candidatus Bathyarchaeota archaeon]|nr:polyprenyl synthetase family protein [Candidatus Bathyarchaeota archaeon]
MSKESNAKKLIAVLNQKSHKSIQLAKQTILEKKFSSENINQIIQKYISGWNDATRPGTLALAYEAAGGKTSDVENLQAALLLIDVTMDIHDDIIDESTMKKNKKTVYGRLGKNSTLLLGDAFMVEGFSQLYKAVENLPKTQQEKIMATVQDFLIEVVDAHLIESQLKNKKWTLTPETYLQVLTKKAADIDGRMRAGAIYGGGTDEEIEILSKLGRNLGILLIIRAEFVDIYDSDELSNRVKNECLPLPILYAIRNRGIKTKIKQVLDSKEIGESECEEVLALLEKSTDIAELKSYLAKIVQESLTLLGKLNENQAKKHLQQLFVSLLEDL